MAIISPPSGAAAAAWRPRSERQSDEQLAGLAQEGSREAFAELVRRYAGRLHAFIRTRVRDTHDAEELTQDTLLRAWTAIARFDTSRRFSTWLFTIAHRQATDLIRARTNRPTPLAITDETRPDRACAITPRGPREPSRVWSVALDVLTPEAYETLWLSYVEGRTAAEIGRITQRNHVAVRVSLHRARQAIRDALERDPSGESHS